MREGEVSINGRGRRVRRAATVAAGLLALGIAPDAASADPPQPPASPPPPLYGETLLGLDSTPGASANGSCLPGGATLHFTGDASGPYSGTFTATLTITPRANNPLDLSNADLQESFTITSAAGTVTGTKAGPLAYDSSSAGDCDFSRVEGGVSYSAVIHTTTGNYQTSGNANLTGYFYSTVQGFGFIEPFKSSNGVFLISPTSTDQCKHDGYQNYPQFKNQGDCVSFVRTGGKNPASN